MIATRRDDPGTMQWYLFAVLFLGRNELSGFPPHQTLDSNGDEQSKSAPPAAAEVDPHTEQVDSGDAERTPAGTAGRVRRRRRSRVEPTRSERWAGLVAGGLQWTALALLLGLPVYLAWDYGGILPWSQWLASGVVLGASAFAAPLVIARSGSGGRNRLVIPLIALAIWGLAWLQTVPLAGSTTARISPGSAAAYSEWIPAGLRSEFTGTHPEVASIFAGQFPISVSTHLTRAASNGPALFAAVCLLAAVLFRSRTLLVTLLAAVAISGAAIAFLGISDQIRAPAPQGNAAAITPEVAAGAPFGSFVCRNNAAAYLNLTLAAAVGLLVFCFRLAHDRARGDGTYVLEPESWWDRPVFFLQNLLLQIDTATIAALILVILNVAGVLSSQSRGGTLALISGTLVTTLLTGSRQMRWWRPLAILVSVSGVMMLLGSIGLIGRIGERLESLWSGDATRDGRLDHWPDGLAAAWNYFPGGAGLGTYRFAYLPYQQTSSGAWFVNADNMAVEWLVEGGVWLLPLALAAVACFAVSLTRLARIRNAPHLTALAACGWFVIGSQLVSQFFDFGILLPSNYLTLALLVGGVLGALSRDYSRSKRGSAANASGECRFGLALPVTFALAMLTVVSAQRITHQHAADDHLVREIFRAGQPLQLDGAISERALRGSPNPMLHTALATHFIAEQAERGKQALKRVDPEQTVDHARLATLDARRAAYYLQAQPNGQPPEMALLPEQSLESVRAARQHALSALVLCPLSDAPRFHLLQTDFLSADSRQLSEQLLQQWGVLRCRSGLSLERASRLAAVHPGADAATPLIHQTLWRAPERLPHLWPIIDLLGTSVAVTEFLPDDPALLLRVLERFSLEPALRDQLAARLRNLLVADGPARDDVKRVDTAERHYLTGRLELLEQRPAQAEAAFARAVAADPSTTEYRYQWAESLARLGKREQAISQIKLCLLQAPDNARYRARRDAWTTATTTARDSGPGRRRQAERHARAARGS